MRYGDECISTGRRHVRLTAHKIGPEQPFKAPKVRKDRTIAICLNCEMPNCKGSCEKVKRNAVQGRK